MIEGQENVTWEQWLALAGACEEHGLEALFRSDHYESVMGMRERGAPGAWPTPGALPGPLPASVGAGQERGHGRPRLRGAGRAGAGRRLARGRAPRLLLRVPADT